MKKEKKTPPEQTHKQTENMVHMKYYELNGSGSVRFTTTRKGSTWLLAVSLPPQNSRRGPQVTDTQGSRGTKYILGALITSFCRSDLLHRIKSCQKCALGQILLPDSHGLLENISCLFLYSVFQHLMLLCRCNFERQPVYVMAFLILFFLSAFIFDKPSSFMCVHSPFLLVFTLTASKQWDL